nr:DNA adenine methylase [Bifidobacterium catenulatum]
MQVPNLVQYQGSKRKLAPQIMPFFPRHSARMIEPFCGMASMTLAIAQNGMADEYWLNDLNKDVADVLRAAIDEPERLISEYGRVWTEQFDWDGGHVEHYLFIRDEYNRGRANDGMFLYLVARVAKGAIRYSSNGMNQYVDRRRHGTKPDTMAKNIMMIHALLHGRTQVTSMDYKDILAECCTGDVVYMDPPYQGTSGKKDSRYIAGVSVDELEKELHVLDRREIPYILSYDGVCGDKSYGRDLDPALQCRKLLLNAGRSSQATLNGINATTFEALYVSDRLTKNRPEAEQIMLEV